ncbi:hypothetical protein CANCADRAFT_30303 [Tortispora caseinolytica NRRL Y-17796]|uniref:Enoyl reductase (ER) domain-containing protein n=1 Tax=Tortispora caseinolytica NRRL Y-17796 TaxID=767744 RepID=A0A1E4TJU6_9ASCO|nr:hypothetical protein CANCADRAFT_30303 [Tortispora caseinolytica NRRL Y-17796]
MAPVKSITAVRFHGANNITVDEVACPEINHPHDVLFEPHWSGICGTDLHEYECGPVLIPHPGHPHPLTKAEPPVTIGHEMSGVVVEVGSAVTKVKPGDKICIEAVISCGKCYACSRGQTNCCTDRGFYGLSGIGGGFAELSVAPESIVHKLPNDIDLKIGALVEPLAVAYHAVKLGDVKEGDTALILGAGPIGIACILALQIVGFSKIYVSEPALIRRNQAERFGATVIDPLNEDTLERVREITNNAGVDVTFDCAGNQLVAELALNALRPGGKAVIIAISAKPFIIDYYSLLIDQEKSLVGSICYNYQDFEDVIDALRTKKIDPSPMITGTINARHIVEHGFEQLVHHKEEHIKIIGTLKDELLYHLV